MSCDFGIWTATRRLSDQEAESLYGELCEGGAPDLPADPAIDAFYGELTSIHPELDDVVDGEEVDEERCPWSGPIERSPAHLLINCVWSKADDVEALLLQLATKHRVALFNPQTSKLHPPARPWWRVWG